MTKCRNPPATRSWDLGHQPVDVEPVEEPTDLRTLPLRILAEAKETSRELGSQVAIRETVHGMFPAHERHEELILWPGHGVKGRDRPAGGRTLPSGDGVESAQARGGVVDLR
jgi:hypothetical protein